MTPSTNQKVHLRKTSQRTACGKPCGVSAGQNRALRTTDTPSRVTCELCKRSLFMADVEVLRQRRSRRK